MSVVGKIVDNDGLYVKCVKMMIGGSWFGNFGFFLLLLKKIIVIVVLFDFLFDFFVR